MSAIERERHTYRALNSEAVIAENDWRLPLSQIADVIGSWGWHPSAAARANPFADLDQVTEFEEKYFRQKSRIEFLCLRSRFAESLGDRVLDLAADALRSFKLAGILPSLINPTGDESLLFEFFIDANFYAIEFYPSDEIVYLSRRANLKSIICEIEPNQLGEVVDEISRYAQSYVR